MGVVCAAHFISHAQIFERFKVIAEGLVYYFMGQVFIRRVVDGKLVFVTLGVFLFRTCFFLHGFTSFLYGFYNYLFNLI